MSEPEEAANASWSNMKNPNTLSIETKCCVRTEKLAAFLPKAKCSGFRCQTLGVLNLMRFI